MNLFGLFAPSFLFLATLVDVRASVVAVVDSGIDVGHPDIVSSVWVNPVDLPGNGYDEDWNGFLNDINGWNFAENNGVLIEWKYAKYFTPEVKKFFKIQADMGNGNFSGQDIAWIKNKRKSRKFLKQIQICSNFVHGTHVGGIAVVGTKKAKLLTVKVEQGKVFKGRWRKGQTLSSVVKSQVGLLAEVVHYVDGHGADIANFSFGMGHTLARRIVADFVGSGLLVDSDDIGKMAEDFLDEFVAKGRDLLKRTPDILFVIAAGNDGTDNDSLKAFPANINLDNTITVAATFKDRKLASFSNYGMKTVEIAAPGVSIRSAVPGGGHLSISGTSQAAPFVTKAASMIKDSNSSLTPGQIKKILMGTVTKKSFLKNRVVSEGVLNRERAVYAAELSNAMDVDLAIEYSLKEIDDPFVAKSNASSLVEEWDGMVFPLPTLLPAELTSGL